jgi:hypothetical protein
MLKLFLPQPAQAPDYIVKVYDPLGTVPPYYRTASGTWHRDRILAKRYPSERAACAFIAGQGRFTCLELCAEVAR